jgi:hypothetical protein
MQKGGVTIHISKAQERIFTHHDVKITAIRHLERLGYKVLKTGEYPLPIGAYRRFPDIYATKDDEVIIIECRGGPEARFHSVINALGQVLAIKAHYPKIKVVVAVPSTWGDDCLSEQIRKTYSVKLWLVNSLLDLVTES